MTFPQNWSQNQVFDPNKGLEDLRKKTENSAPDGGFGWFVVAGQFIMMGLYGGFLKSLTVFFIPLRDAFK